MMNRLKLGTQLNIAFALVLFIPMVLATGFSINYYSHKISRQAIDNIASDARTAEIIMENRQAGMAAVSSGLASQKGLPLLIEYKLGRKIGMEWAPISDQKDLDMISVISPDFLVIARSHAPETTGDVIAGGSLIHRALEGHPAWGMEVLDREFARREGILSQKDGATTSLLSMTGASPVFSAGSGDVIAVVVVRRILNWNPDRLLRPVAGRLGVHAALLVGDTEIGRIASPQAEGGYTPPAPAELRQVYGRGKPVHIARIEQDGAISGMLPVLDADARAVGILVIQTGVEKYLKTRQVAALILLGVGIAGFILALLIKTIITRRIVIPVERLKTEAKKIGGGNYGSQIVVTSGDEIGELTTAFNTMVADLAEYDRQIKEYNQQLEKRVAERTQELQDANEQLTEANMVLEDTLETLNPGISRLIKRNQQQLGLVFATELVADICNYTKLNMILGETLMGEFMKKFFREGHKLLAMYRGLFDKTVGDQIVAIFGTPKDQSPASATHPADAVACALSLVAAADDINRLMQQAIQDNYSAIKSRYETLSREDQEGVRIEDLRFQCRVGINTSNPGSDREIDRMRMVMMGAETCADYTAQGGAVIYAFRVESNGVPGEIHIGENTRRLVDHVFLLEDMLAIRLKGLGAQNRYRVTGIKSVFDTVYPRTRLYLKYRDHIPRLLISLMDGIRIGKIQLREVRKINEFIEVDIPYMEHLAGYSNRAMGRSLFAWAMAGEIGLPRNRINALIFAALWHAAASLPAPNIGQMTPYAVFRNIPEDIDTNLVTAILTALEDSDAAHTRGDGAKPEKGAAGRMEAEIISICAHYDDAAFDRTLLRSRKKETLSAVEIIRNMRETMAFSPSLIDVLEGLMVVSETGAAEKGKAKDIRFAPDLGALPEDMDHLVRLLRERLTPDQRRDLASALEVETAADTE